jgi:hypothetical protein
MTFAISLFAKIKMLMRELLKIALKTQRHAYVNVIINIYGSCVCIRRYRSFAFMINRGRG